MKKIVITMVLMLVLNPAQAKDLKYINCIPYKEYKKEINLNQTNSTAIDLKNVNIIKNTYEFKYICKKMGLPQEYFITNNTGDDLVLTGIHGGKKYFNRDLERKHSKRIMPMVKACFTTWYFYIPYLNIVFGGLSDAEKNKFIRDFPKNITVKDGEKIRVLCIEMEKGSNLQFVFEHNTIEF